MVGGGAGRRALWLWGRPLGRAAAVRSSLGVFTGTASCFSVVGRVVAIQEWYERVNAIRVAVQVAFGKFLVTKWGEGLDAGLACWRAEIHMEL